MGWSHTSRGGEAACRYREWTSLDVSAISFCIGHIAVPFNAFGFVIDETNERERETKERHERVLINVCTALTGSLVCVSAHEFDRLS